MHSPQRDLDLAHDLADLAGAAITPHFRTSEAAEDKSGGRAFDPVTAADRGAEEAMRRHLAIHRPDDGVFGEEFARTTGTSGRTWILDPVDGTRAFLMGLPIWGTLIALSETDERAPSVGIMDQSFVGERFAADENGATWRKGGATVSIEARRCASLGQALAATTSPDLFKPATRARYDKLAERVRMMRFGTDCYAYALLAAGHIDVVMEEGLRAFDIAPFVPLIEQAGGSITDYAGHPIGPTLLTGFKGEVLALGDPQRLDEALSLLSA